MTTSDNDKAVILYQSPDGTASLEVRLDHETVWLTQPQLADLFDVNVPAVSKHIRNIRGVVSWMYLQLFPKWKEFRSRAGGKSSEARFYTIWI